LRNFWLGLGVGMLVGGGIVFVFLRIGPTEIESAAVEAPDGGEEKTPVKKRRRTGVRAPGIAGDDPPPTLSEADLRVSGEGDALRVRERTVDLASREESRDLTQPEIDAAIKARGEELVDCVVQARGPADLSGRVTFGVVVTASGSVSQVRVDAPSYLLRNGLYRCARPKLLSLRFPAAGKDTVIRVPFDIE
jgi:hypothetical protein